MQRTLVSALTWLVVALPSVGVVAAQSDAPTPYAEYRAGVEAFQTAGESSSDGQMPTVEAVIESFSANIDRTRAEVGRLMAITPEPCYADAHAEMIAFREYVIVTYRDTLPLIEDAESVMGMFPMLLAADATVRAAHPAAYVPDESNMTGFRLEPLNILDTMATCGPGGPAQPSQPAGSPVASPAVGPAASAPPGSLIHRWVGREIVTLPGGPVRVSWADEGCALTLTWESEAGVDVEIVHTVDVDADSTTVELPAGPGRLDVSAGCFTDAPPWSVEFSEP